MLCDAVRMSTDCACIIYGGLLAHWVVHQWQLYERSLCSLLDQARKRSYVCCSPRYVLAPDYAPHLFPLPLAARHSPPPAHL